MKESKKEIMEELREKLASIEHERWAHWQKYMHSLCREGSVTGTLIIPAHLVDRWEKQINTPYAALSEKQKKSDRDQVDKYLPLIEEVLFQVEQDPEMVGQIIRKWLS